MQGQGDAGYRFGPFRVDTIDERLIGPGGPVKLGNKAYRVLLALIEAGGRLVTKDSLFESVWDGTTVSESALTSVIKELRRALGDDARTPHYIESAYGRGYRFVAAADRDGTPFAPAGAARLASAAASAQTRPPEQPPLLFLAPIDDAAVRAAEPYLASSIRAELLLALSRFREIRLATADRLAPQAGSAFSPRDYQLQLTLLNSSEKVRIFVHLTSLATGLVLWSDRAELGGAQGKDVERLIRRILSDGLPRLYKDVVRYAPAEPGDIYNRYFANQLRMRGQSSLAEARAVAAEWEAIIEVEPEFAPAYPPLIRLYNTDYAYCGLGSSGSSERARADHLAHLLVAMDPQNAHFHTAKGFCDLWAGRASEARLQFEEALSLNSYHQARLVELSTGFAYLDDLDRAEALLREHDALTPFPAEMPHEGYALLHLLKEQYALAREHGALARRTHPDDLAQPAPSVFGQLYSILGAAGEDAPDLPARGREWLASLERRWANQHRFTEQSVRDWLSFHLPLQNPDRKRFVFGLVDKVIAACSADCSGIDIGE